MNIECDFVNPSRDHFENYKLLIVPALYTASDELLERLNKFVSNGGHIVYTFKSGFTTEHVQVRTSHQPGIINEVCGIYYNQFVEPKNVSLKNDPFEVGEQNNYVETWMELITPTTAEVLAYYDHPHWGEYAAITQNSYGMGVATYIGAIPSPAIMGAVLKQSVEKAGLWGKDQELAFPLITKQGMNEAGETIRYYFNYSEEVNSFNYPYKDGVELISETEINKDERPGA